MTGGAGRGRELVARALAWVEANPAGWAELLAACRMLAADGLPVRRDNVYSDSTRRRLRVSDTPEYAKAHDLWSALARYVALYVPEADVRLARCTVDEAYPTLQDLPPLPESAAR